MVAPDPSRLRRSLVFNYLSTEEMRITRVEQNGQVHFRFAGSGRPAEVGSRGGRDYTVTALVTPEGLVRNLTVSVTLRGNDGNYDVHFEMTLDQFGETVVDPPDWVSRESSAESS